MCVMIDMKKDIGKKLILNMEYDGGWVSKFAIVPLILFVLWARVAASWSQDQVNIPWVIL